MPTATVPPTYTPRPLPTATPSPTPTPQPTPTRSRRILDAARTPEPPSLLDGIEFADRLERDDPRVATLIKTVPWVADGIDDSERAAAERLVRNGRWYPELLQALLNKPWVRDSMNPLEIEVARRLAWMHPHAELETLGLLDMEFLETVEPADVAAVESLYKLAIRTSDRAFLRVLGHPRIADGIDDREAKIVALLFGTNQIRPELVDVLLRGAGVYLEERTIELPHSGEVLLTIVRVRDKTTPMIDYLEHSVRVIEDFMAAPLPTNYVALYIDDVTTYAIGGNNFGTHMSMSLLYDVENSQTWRERTGHTIAHEVAHYYWTGNQTWLNEGVAELLGSISENARTGDDIATTRYPCVSAKSILQLESLRARALTKAYGCNYSLGESLMVDLYYGLGEETFRDGLRDLYRLSLADDGRDFCRGTRLGICHLNEAFRLGKAKAVQAAVDDVLDRWYYGLAP